jgi:hypothetical protein
METTILDLDSEVVGFVIGSVPAIKAVKVDVEHLDVETLLLVDILIFKFVYIIIHDFFCHQKLILNCWEHLNSPMLVVQRLMWLWLQPIDILL